jgi:hypothetical protein
MPDTISIFSMKATCNSKLQKEIFDLEQELKQM